MDNLYSFAQTATPLALFALVLGALVYGFIILINKLTKNQTTTDKIRNTQLQKYPEIEEHIQRFNILDAKLEKIASNHLHELPQMMQSITRIESKVDKIAEVQDVQGNRITRLEALGE